MTFNRDRIITLYATHLGSIISNSLELDVHIDVTSYKALKVLGFYIELTKQFFPSNLVKIFSCEHFPFEVNYGIRAINLKLIYYANGYVQLKNVYYKFLRFTHLIVCI